MGNSKKDKKVDSNNRKLDNIWAETFSEHALVLRRTPQTNFPAKSFPERNYSKQ